MVRKQISVSTWFPLFWVAIGTGFLLYSFGIAKDTEMGFLAKPACHGKSQTTKARSNVSVSSFYTLSSRFVWLELRSRELRKGRVTTLQQNRFKLFGPLL